MSHILEDIRRELREQSDEAIKNSSGRFFKEEVSVYGVKTPVVKRIGNTYFKELKDESKKEVFRLCHELWQSGYLEEAIIACNWSYALRSKFEPEDFTAFEKWVTLYVTNWAACDTLCNHTIGAFIEMYPQFIEKLKSWAKSDNLWVCRAASVSLIVPARKGKFLHDVLEIANILMQHKEDLVQKGYGWLLKVTSQAHQEEVFQYVMKHKSVMPRTALRYAIEKMPKELKSKAMSK